MSEAVAEKTDKAPAAGGNKKLLIIVIAASLLIIGVLGGAVFILYRNMTAAQAAGGAAAHGGHKKAAAEEGEEGEEGHAKAEEEEEEEEEEGGGEGHDGKKKAGKFGPLLEVGSFIANLAGAPGAQPRYAKVTLHAEALNEDAKARLEAGLVPLKSEALLVLSNAKAEDLVGQEKITAVADEILKRGNKLLGKRSIKRVYFSELVVQ